MDDLEKQKSAPNVLITTSHNPSHFLRRVGKLLSYTFPFTEKLARGSLNLRQIHNFCWNNNIEWLFILKDSETKSTAFINFYDFTKSRKLINATIKLTNFNFPSKGDSKSRIDVKRINLKFSSQENKSMNTKILENMKNLQMSHLPQTKHSDLTIEFQKITGSQINGIVLRDHYNEIIPVFSFEATFPEVL